MAKPKGGLTAWFGKGPKGDWVDIGAPKKKGKFQACGRSKLAKDKKRKYPKCVPRATANRMTKSQITSAVKRKRAKAQGVGGKPTNVRTFAKKKKKEMVAKLETIRKKIKQGKKLGFSERARAVNKGLLPSKAKKKKKS